MTHINKAASLVTAHVHIHGGLGVIRQECFQDPTVHLVFFVSLRRVHQLMLNQLKYLWYIFQNTIDMFRGASLQWLQESVRVFNSDLDGVEATFFNWNPPNITIQNRTDSDKLVYGMYESPGVLSTVEMLRRDTFKEWKWDKDFVKVMMRWLFKKDDQVLEIGSHTGQISLWLNETGWVQAYPWDEGRDIGILSFQRVSQLNNTHPAAPPKIMADPTKDQDGFPYDWMLCVSEACAAFLDKLEKEGGSGWNAFFDKVDNIVVASRLFEKKDGEMAAPALSRPTGLSVDAARSALLKEKLDVFRGEDTTGKERGLFGEYEVYSVGKK